MTLIEFIDEQIRIREGLHSIGWTRDARTLQVLGYFQKGDAEMLNDVLEFLKALWSTGKDNTTSDIKKFIEHQSSLKRLAEAAKLMEEAQG